MLRLSVVEHLSKIARVERLPADWAVDKVLRFVIHWPVMRLALVAGSDVVSSDPRHLSATQTAAFWFPSGITFCSLWLI
ncbi:hypothetical protein [Mesorhizobium sp. M0220]|uniref:hypothetical protein n=1 Tax=Mesorhizobium sp. M0220 TaxID=2956920 RepID=UPI0033397A68